MENNDFSKKAELTFLEKQYPKMIYNDKRSLYKVHYNDIEQIPDNFIHLSQFCCKGRGILNSCVFTASEGFSMRWGEYMELCVKYLPQPDGKTEWVNSIVKIISGK